MRIISTSEYNELQRKLARLEELEEEKQSDKDKKEVVQLRERIKTLQEEHTREISKIRKAQIATVEEIREEQQEDERAVAKTHNLEIDELEDKISALDAQIITKDRKIKLLTEQVATIEKREIAVTKKEAELEGKDLEVEAKFSIMVAGKNAVKTVDDQIDQLTKEADERVTKARDEGYKGGYADGVCDGVREGRNLGDDDRRMLEKVVLVSLSKNDPSIQEELGQIVKDNLKNVLSPKQAAKSDSKKS